MAARGLKRVASEGSASRSEDVGVAEATMGRNGTSEEANEVEVATRGTAAGRTGGRERRRASEGGTRGMLQRSRMRSVHGADRA